MKKLLLGLILAVFVAAPLQAQSGYLRALGRYMDAETITYTQTAEDTDIALFVRYVGTDVGTNTVEVNAGGDLLFVDAGTAGPDVSVICPSGGTGGTIDVSDAACDTLGEVIDIIVGDANWTGAIHAGLRSDTSTDTLLLLAAADAGLVEGLSLEWDTDVANTVTWVVSLTSSLQDYVGNDRTGDVLSNPYAGLRAVFQEMSFNIDFSVSLGTYAILSVAVDNVAETETVNTIVTGLSAADATLTTVQPLLPFGYVGGKNEKMIVRFTDGGTIAGVTLVNFYGFEMESR